MYENEWFSHGLISFVAFITVGLASIALQWIICGLVSIRMFWYFCMRYIWKDFIQFCTLSIASGSFYQSAHFRTKSFPFFANWKEARISFHIKLIPWNKPKHQHLTCGYNKQMITNYLHSVQWKTDRCAYFIRFLFVLKSSCRLFGSRNASASAQLIRIKLYIFNEAFTDIECTIQPMNSQAFAVSFYCTYLRKFSSVAMPPDGCQYQNTIELFH